MWCVQWIMCASCASSIASNISVAARNAIIRPAPASAQPLCQRSVGPGFLIYKSQPQWIVEGIMISPIPKFDQRREGNKNTMKSIFLGLQNKTWTFTKFGHPRADGKIGLEIFSRADRGFFQSAMASIFVVNETMAQGRVQKMEPTNIIVSTRWQYVNQR